MEMTVKDYPLLKTGGIQFLSSLADGWYRGMDYTDGDLYEAEELYRDGHPIRSNRLVFVHFPEGKIYEPMRAAEGQYFGLPVMLKGAIYLLRVDFAQEEIKAFCWIPEAEKPQKANTDGEEAPFSEISGPAAPPSDKNEAERAKPISEIFCLPLAAVKDCYNLHLTAAPLCLTRQGHENDFQLIWPERGSFPIAPSESLDSRDGSVLLFSQWFEDPAYREETVVRRIPDGKILERLPGSLFTDPEGRRWVLK